MQPHEMTPEEWRTLLWALLAGVCFIVVALLTILHDAGRNKDDNDDDGPGSYPIFPPF
jgi:hypothetical protein